MSSEQRFRQYIDIIRQQIASKSELADHWEKLTAAVEELELTYEEMQTQLEAAEVIDAPSLPQALGGLQVATWQSWWLIVD